jgi:hypothetical protein
MPDYRVFFSTPVSAAMKKERLPSRVRSLAGVGVARRARAGDEEEAAEEVEAVYHGAASNNPHPNPLPEYMEREKEGGDGARQSFLHRHIFRQRRRFFFLMGCGVAITIRIRRQFFD